MALTASNVSSLAETLTKWEYAEYFFAALVTIACFGEFVAEFTNWFTNGVEHRKKQLEKISTLILVGALALELVCLVNTNALASKLIGSLGDLSQAAANNAGTAVGNAGAAVKVSENARGVASNAMTLARGARQEADSFERDIVSAKTQAADAESHLAEALKRAVDASAELNRLKSPRSLTNISELVDALKPFKGTELEFLSVFGDDESFQLLKQLDNALSLAGWKRLTHSVLNIGVPALQISGRDDLVNIGVNTGIRIAVDSSETLDALQALPRDKLPSHVRVAVILNELIFSHLSPPEVLKPENRVGVDPGPTTAIRIQVGKKP